MKEPSVVFIAFVLIIKIAGMACNIRNFPCKQLNFRCFNHAECCTQYCSQPLERFDIDSSCKQQPVEPSIIIASNGICEFHLQTDEDEIAQQTDAFGLYNAAHESLPPLAQIMVLYEQRYLLVTINDRIPRSNGTLLDLSNEAAYYLRIRNEGYVHCSIVKVMHSYTFELIVYGLPMMSFLILLLEFFLNA